MESSYSEAMTEVRNIVTDELAKAREKRESESDDDGKKKKRRFRSRRPGRGGLCININCEKVEIDRVVIFQKDEG